MDMTTHLASGPVHACTCSFCGSAVLVRLMRKYVPVFSDLPEAICADCYPEWGHPEMDWADWPLQEGNV